MKQEVFVITLFLLILFISTLVYMGSTNEFKCNEIKGFD
jgi:hypothetical protein